MKNKKIINLQEANKLFKNYKNGFALVNNPEGVHPTYELYPFTPKLKFVNGKLQAALMDMDGTLTTTEELCLHSLEYMIRKLSGRMNRTSWGGLDHVKDYPHIIGNSTTKHVEYLIRTYNSTIKQDLIPDNLIYAILWTLVFGFDKSRKTEVKITLNQFGISNLLKDSKYIELLNNSKNLNDIDHRTVKYFSKKYLRNFSINNFSLLVRAGIDVYYQRYHEILEKIKLGKGQELSNLLLGESNKHLIEPMPGVGIFISLVKGWLGDEAGNLFDELYDNYFTKTGLTKAKSKILFKNNLNSLSKIFTKNPIKLGLATSSIFYEADIVLSEMFNVVKSIIQNWKISDTRKKQILVKFSNYENVFDSIVTASDSNEIRLKPHRDLYSISLMRLGIPNKNFDKVIGFEDSESGITAIRSAGIGLAIAVPFTKTKGHFLEASSYVLTGGLPESILKYNLFIK